MPTILRIDSLRVDSLRVVIYPNDHRPAHVHVVGPGSEAVFFLNCPDGPPELRDLYGFKLAEASRIQDGLAATLTSLCNSWRKFHGDY